MVYRVKQANSITRNFGDLKEVFAVTAVGFRPIVGDNVERYVQTELYNLHNSELPWQVFYVMDGPVAIASMLLLIRKGSFEGKTDICITWVHTNENYRKIGLMEDLFKFVLALYERKELVCDKTRYVLTADVLDETVAFLKQNRVDGGYWTLYSIVESYYAKYDFHGIRNFDYFKQKPELVLCSNEFSLKGNEEYVTVNNYMELIYNEKYIPYDLSSKNPKERSCNFMTTSVPSLVRRLECMLKFVNEPLNHLGLHITDLKGETFVLMAQHYGPYEGLVQRFYTSVEDEDLLHTHLDRMYAYLSHYLKTNYYKLCGNETPSEAQILWIAKNDMFTTTPKAREIACSYFRNKGWTFDDTNTENLAMVREWGGGPIDGLVWTHNGFWSYN